jgi:hypothetical protein
MTKLQNRCAISLSLIVPFLATAICVPSPFTTRSKAQSPNRPVILGRSDDPVIDIVPLKLNYEKPVTYNSGTKRSAILADFRCGSDGSVFFPVVEDSSLMALEQNQFGQASRGHDILLTALTPSGDVVRFAYDSIPGLRNFISEVRYFVSNSRVYTLEVAEAYDPVNPGKSLGRVHVIMIYDYKGSFQRIVRLEPGLNPINIAAFGSGDILVVSLDKLNQRARLLVFDSAGRQQTELRPFDDDAGANMVSAAKSIQGLPSSVDGAALSSMLALAQWTPRGDNLLLTPNQARLPVIEVNEHGLVRSTALALPEGEFVGSLLLSDTGHLRVLTGHLSYYDAKGGSVETPSTNGQTSFRPHEIEEFNPLDGSLLRRIQFADGLVPVCGRDDTYTFVGSRAEDGRTQLVSGTVVR